MTSNAGERVPSDATVAGYLIQLLGDRSIPALAEEVLALVCPPTQSGRYSYSGVLGWVITAIAMVIVDQESGIEDGDVLVPAVSATEGEELAAEELTASLRGLLGTVTAQLTGEHVAVRTYLAAAGRLPDPVARAEILVDALMCLDTLLDVPFPDLPDRLQLPSDGMNG
ncbi:hypothetical protein [Rhodococcus sp. T7]|uniref:hypothetical protein n=1 Tax=Rhodococcus sp. T7 TaxID=627444 RepID=UPI001359AEF9|nr:hypothetical protein [Rhodococcus sp. T7]KAF0957367.1 hypothetical protein MLGJGCBP_09199 [Rhodococcus sp. T7]KAF0962162.1 hypothetical protein MLGJGCBP_04783 [Rhodococcus sp. T7]